jgi:transposase InsO family protein
VTYDEKLVGIIRKIRQENPSFSAVKISYILVRDFVEKTLHVSAATIGRIIKRFNLFFSRLVRLHKDHAASARRGWIKRRAKTKKPYGLKAIKPHQIIEFDMKHIWIRRPGANIQKHYAFCAIDPYTKEALIHISSKSNANCAEEALKKVLDYFGQNIVILNDNGSENMGKAYDYLKEQNITQLFARPHEPKDKPHVENFIGKLQKECLDEDDGNFKTVAERQQQVDRWLNTYHFYRPHQALNYQTPQEFCDTLGLTIPHRKMSTM